MPLSLLRRIVLADRPLGITVSRLAACIAARPPPPAEVRDTILTHTGCNTSMEHLAVGVEFT
eukprot:1176121-Prorocentrum_minimum.AAC.3